MDKKRAVKVFLRLSATMSGIILGFLLYSNHVVESAASGRFYSVLDSLPSRDVGIVLGCAPYIDGRPNPYFWGRMRAAAQLQKLGRVRVLLVSGDNGRAGYDEPRAMREALESLGIPHKAIVCDFAGFRTLDTMVRAHKVFGLSQATVITDDFHMARSLYCAQQAGIDCVGFPSHVGRTSQSNWLNFREAFGKMRAVMDMQYLHTQPTYLGKAELIPPPASG